MAIKEWTKLTCDCGSIEFTATHELVWKDGQGVTTKAHGYKCAACDKRVGTAALIDKQKLINKQKELSELQNELNG